jgi:hypothetical protein
MAQANNAKARLHARARVGVLAHTVNHPGTINDTGRPLVLGDFTGTYWAGSIDEVFIYNKVLTQSEVTQLYDYK